MTLRYRNGLIAGKVCGDPKNLTEPLIPYDVINFVGLLPKFRFRSRPSPTSPATQRGGPYPYAKRDVNDTSANERGRSQEYGMASVPDLRRGDRREESSPVVSREPRQDR